MRELDYKNKIIHILFADDLLLFAYGDLDSMKELMLHFAEFSQCSGLVVNCDKSELYYDDIGDEVKQQIREFLNMPEGVRL